ncbi:hypothetical protein [Luteitalea sp. TBR-22]|uniref:hypothetical protein n=1 Tax=Luteitalea sp. TBR-22 TaxID=2802971 RepID=UPI001EF43006|nr:hypothetical protein [Luteitalea sp. TBR-22]
MPPTRPFIATVLLLGVGIGSSPVHAQQPAARQAADLERIRRTFATQPTESKFIGPVRADYSVRVEEAPEDLDYHFGWIYDQTTATPGYVRPWYPIYHYQMQSLTIPTEHRAQLYPAGVPVSGATVGAIKNAFRKRKERKAKEEVAAEVAAIKKSGQ